MRYVIAFFIVVMGMALSVARYDSDSDSNYNVVVRRQNVEVC